MAPSAVLQQWLCGGTCWFSTLFLRKKQFKSSENSLSRMWRVGAYPLFLMFLYQYIPALWIVLPCLFGSDLYKISLES